MSTVIRIENLSKYYRLGVIGSGTLREDLQRGWARLRGRSDPLSKVDARDHGNQEGNQIWALRDVGFEVKQGEVLGIIGCNGAGKSTLLKILSRITAPTEGRVLIKGRVASLLEVGTGMHPELTGRENTYLNGAILGMTKAEVTRKLDEIVAFAEISEFIDTPVKRYSSGMRVRLGFAIAAHLEPEILIVDEVLAVGDAAFQKKCLGKMGDVAEHGRTILFVSHNMIALQNLCPRAVWLDRGRLRGRGDSPGVIADYLHTQLAMKTRNEWPDFATAPGNEQVRLRRIWVRSEAEREDGLIPREAPITIGVEYYKADSESQLHINLQMYVDQQVIAFATASAHDPEWTSNAHGQGLFRCICRIPANFLNIGQHRVKLLAVVDRSRPVFVMDDALSFEVVETGQREGSWFGKSVGVVRPILPWSNQHVGDQWIS